MTRLGLMILILAASLSGCNRIPQLAPPDLEVRDFVIKEEKTEKTEYSKAYNTFKGAGSIVARNIDSDRNIVVILELRDETLGPNSEPILLSVLVKGGIGKVQTHKSKYGEISDNPKYIWSVLGWYELNKASIQVAGQPNK